MSTIRLWIKAPSMAYAVECCNEHGLSVKRQVFEGLNIKHMIVDVKASATARATVEAWYNVPWPPRPEAPPFGTLLTRQ